MMAGEGDSKFIRGARSFEGFVVEYGPTLLVVVAGLGWTIFRNWILGPPEGHSFLRIAGSWLAGLGLTAAGILGGVFTYKRTGSIRKLRDGKESAEREVESLKDTLLRLSSSFREAWKNRLLSIFQDLNLDHNFRISLYRYNSESQTFKMLGRYASIDKFEKVGRGIYPADVGCIGEAWESSELEAYADDLPNNEEDYIRVSCERWKFDEETVRGLNMKSRSVYAFVLMDAHQRDRTALVVFESVDQNAADVAVLREAAQSTFRKQILSDLESLEFIEPEPNIAIAAGF